LPLGAVVGRSRRNLILVGVIERQKSTAVCDRGGGDGGADGLSGLGINISEAGMKNDHRRNAALEFLLRSACDTVLGWMRQ